MLIISLILACSPDQATTDSGAVLCGLGTHIVDATCVVDTDTDADTDIDSDTDTDTGEVVPQYCVDADGDQFFSQSSCADTDHGNPSYYQLVASPSLEDWDCADNDPDTFPGAANLDSATACMTDADGDGYGLDIAQGIVESGTDCDDADPEINQSTTEVDDTVDNDCDGEIDEPADVTKYYDADGDSVGGDISFTAPPDSFTSSWVDVTGDCDDADATNTYGPTFYEDADGDGYVNIDRAAEYPACTAPSGYGAAAEINDCDDTDGNTYPGAPTVCESGTDANCDGTDDAVDGDGDGALSCYGDCDDENPNIYTGASEVCDGLDNDCDTYIDDGATDAPDWYSDADTDGYGNATSVIRGECTAPVGYVANSTDCNDASVSVNPSAAEVCDSVDNDCDALVDDADPGITGQPTWYFDSDDDSYGGTAYTAVSCAAPAGAFGHVYVDNGQDCLDTNSSVHPGAAEITGNGLDDDCLSSTVD